MGTKETEVAENAFFNVSKTFSTLTEASKYLMHNFSNLTSWKSMLNWSTLVMTWISAGEKAWVGSSLIWSV